MSRPWIQFLCLLSLGAAMTANSALAETVRTRYQEIEVSWPDAVQRERLADTMGLEVMGMAEGEWIRLLSTEDRTAALMSAGFEPRIIHEDLEAHYARRNGTSRAGAGFGLLFRGESNLGDEDLRQSRPRGVE
jgi:hypothetical protein